VGIFSPQIMLCAASVRIGAAGQSFWALWDRRERRLRERTRRRRGAVGLEAGRLRIEAPDLELDVRLEEVPGVETVCRHGAGYAWTRKQAGIAARGELRLSGERLRIEARAVVDDSAGYHARHTSWHWSAGVGHARDGRAVAWNLVSGINDPPRHSERTVWIDGVAHEAPPCRFAPDLGAVGDLRFTPEAVRERAENLLLVRSRYRQPFGTFSGVLPGGLELASGWGVMEAHDVHW
jgi:hypothetical protein